MLVKENDLLIKLSEEYNTLLNRLVYLRSAIIGLGGKVEDDLENILRNNAANKIKKELFIPSKFHNDLPKTQKIAFAINELGGEAFASQIIEFILNKEEEIRNEAVFVGELSSSEKQIMKRNNTLLLSYLHKKHSLLAKRINGKYKYKINKKST